MIGPYEGRELEFMLSGRKHFAFFHDHAPKDSDQIAQTIIPEKAFAPYVISGRIHRASKDLWSNRLKDSIRYVCFTTTGEEWRAQFFLWLKEKCLKEEIEHTPAHDILIGKLLGYGDEDIDTYITQDRVLYS